MSIKKIDGLWWPEADIACRPAALADVVMAEKMWPQLVKGRDVVIQAGGNCGIFPKMLSRHFKTVYTFEPDEENFNCLELNVTEKNVYAYPWALGAKGGWTDLHRDPANAGAHYMEGTGAIPVLTIDEMEYAACDLIALDIEGAEILALMGAEKTINKFKPTIIIEDKGHCKRFGYSPLELKGWLNNHGYRAVSICLRDTIWLAA